MNEQNLFDGTAEYYEKYRVGYPPEFFNYIVSKFGLNGRGRLLDLGCGTGQLTVPLARYFAEVVGVDPESDMLEEAKKRAARNGVKNIKFITERAEDISDQLGTFRLTTRGASFHWMQQREVLRKVYQLTEAGGGIVIVSDSTSPWHEGGILWKEVRKRIVQKYLGEKRQAGNAFYQEKGEKFEDLIDTSPFGGHEEWIYEYAYTWTLEAAINVLYSTSFASRRFYGDKLNNFEQELRAALLKLEPSGIFKENIILQVLLSRRG